MRNDLPSMNAGKAMAQASHASNAFIAECNESPAVKEWTEQTKQGFGTVLVLSVNLEQLKKAIVDADNLDCYTNLVTDPTYPYRTTKEIANLISNEYDTSERSISGDQVTLYREEITCGYVFGTQEELVPVLGQFPLHP